MFISVSDLSSLVLSYGVGVAQVAKVLLQWLEALPQPLLPCHIYLPLVRIVSLDNHLQQVAALQRLLAQVRQIAESTQTAQMLGCSC